MGIPDTPNRIDALRRRIAQCQESIATFARIQEELLAIQKASALGVARARADAVLKLNRETMAVLRQSLVIAENALQHAQV
jgi:hypothetical protein